MQCTFSSCWCDHVYIIRYICTYIVCYKAQVAYTLIILSLPFAKARLPSRSTRSPISPLTPPFTRHMYCFFGHSSDRDYDNTCSPLWRFYPPCYRLLRLPCYSLHGGGDDWTTIDISTKLRRNLPTLDDLKFTEFSLHIFVVKVALFLLGVFYFLLLFYHVF